MISFYQPTFADPYELADTDLSIFPKALGQRFAGLQ